MADIGGVLATGGIGIARVAVGSGLTHLFGSMNRRHQEAREDETRWHNTKLEAYCTFLGVVFQHLHLALHAQAVAKDPDRELQTTPEDYRQAVSALNAAVAPIRIVGPTEVVKAADRLVSATVH